jgi:hypothetical protein
LCPLTFATPHASIPLLFLFSSLISSSPIIITHHPSPPTHHHPSPPITTHHHPSPPITTHHHSSSLITTHHHSSPPIITHLTHPPITTHHPSSPPTHPQGGETDIRAKFYSIAFQLIYEEQNEETGSALMKWKVVDYALAGDIAYF